MATIRPRNPRIPFEIHHDHDEQGSESEEEGEGYRAAQVAMEESEGIDQESIQDDGYSDSDESDFTVDPVVQEDMDKFEETFKGIKERFRLINRIGEGQCHLNS